MSDDDRELMELRKRKLAELMAHAENAAAAEPEAEPEPQGEPAPSDMMPSEPIEVTDKNLLEVADRYPLLVVDCWAPWCGPCRHVEPVVKDLAREMRGSVVFGKLNVDENPQSAQSFGVASIPTFLAFKNGNLADRATGVLPKHQLAAWVRRHLPRGRTPGPRRV